MSAKFKWTIAILALVFIVVIGYSSFQATRDRYQVCMSLHGRTHCAVAQGRSPQEAMRSAQEIDCGLLSRDRDELMVCETTEPQSVQAMPK
ncbi:MAG TPA: hypothetical protein VNJ12_04230 [Candidatus Dormibacteraeota bacterium]|nr:hypothetical protein [Candidatus Dormibacteraeota bacterium]